MGVVGHSEMMTQQVLQVWSVSDNKPGHQNQTEGLIQSLSQYREVKLRRMPIVSFSKAFRMLSLKICGKSKYKMPDLIIGTGHHTHLSLLAYKRCFGGKTVMMMSPSLPNSFFDLCFIPRHDKPVNKKNVIETLGTINRVLPDNSLRVKKDGLILLGGQSKHFKWDSLKVEGQIRKLFQLDPHIKWMIAGSRRTPKEIYEIIKERFPQVAIVLPDTVSSDWLPAQTLKAGQIWVTADSISMIYEALTSGAKTGILELDYDKSTRITREIDRLQSEGRVSTIGSIQNDKPLATIFEADRCAKLLLEKLGL